jgi:hypothetical protein
MGENDAVTVSTDDPVAFLKDFGVRHSSVSGMARVFNRQSRNVWVKAGEMNLERFIVFCRQVAGGWVADELAARY